MVRFIFSYNRVYISMDKIDIYNKSIKKNKPKVGKYQIYALFIGWVITTIGWAKYLAIADPLNNKKQCNCKH